MDKDSVIPRGKFQEYVRFHFKAADFPFARLMHFFHLKKKKKPLTFPPKVTSFGTNSDTNRNNDMSLR